MYINRRRYSAGNGGGQCNPRPIDAGPGPYVFNLEQASLDNGCYRTAAWTGDYLQLTLMSINPGEDIGLEIHHDHDQLLRVEQGIATVMMGPSEDNLNYIKRVSDGWVIMVPAGTWHNVVNNSRSALKLYSVYAPPQHPFGTVQPTKADAENAGY